MKEAEEVENSCNLTVALQVELVSVLKQLLDKAIELCPLVELMMKREESPVVDDDAMSVKTNGKKRAGSEPVSGKKVQLKRGAPSGGQTDTSTKRAKQNASGSGGSAKGSVGAAAAMKGTRR